MIAPLKQQLLNLLYLECTKTPYWEENVKTIDDEHHFIYILDCYQIYFNFMNDLYLHIKDDADRVTDADAYILLKRIEELHQQSRDLFYSQEKKLNFSQNQTLSEQVLEQLDVLRRDFKIPMKTLHLDDKSIHSFSTISTLSPIILSQQSSRSNSPLSESNDSLLPCGYQQDSRSNSPL